MSVIYAESWALLDLPSIGMSHPLGKLVAMQFVSLMALAMRQSWLLVILPDIAVGAVEQLGILVELVLEKRLAKGLLDLAFASMRGLPAVETDRAYDLVDIVDDPLAPSPECHRS